MRSPDFERSVGQDLFLGVTSQRIINEATSYYPIQDGPLENLLLLKVGEQIREDHPEILRLFEDFPVPLNIATEEFNRGLVRGFRIIPENIRRNPIEYHYVKEGIKFLSKEARSINGGLDEEKLYRAYARTDSNFALWTRMDITTHGAPKRDPLFTLGAGSIVAPFYRRCIERGQLQPA